MPLFNCSQCGVVESPALGAYWYERRKGKPVLCSECETGEWHGMFEKSYGKVAEAGGLGAQERLAGYAKVEKMSGTDKKKLPSDPMEALIAEALADAQMSYESDEGGGNPSGLDFRLGNGVEIEVKRFHSPRIADQMSRAENVIAAQGEDAVRFLADLIRGK